ncbi:uncharacterized protein LOC131631411 [Vicia villosa]|uniref:uncharacterized protein LOC131631411 n=1 Tax=Vicia villosa TaxID=3911 RepID=UPI00273B88F6|nr:uncharacterized protein LOC131631411 [Vicia villosa]
MVDNHAPLDRLRQRRQTQTVSARRERATQQGMTQGPGRVRVQVKLDEAPVGSSSAPRSRLSRASSSREVEEVVHEKEEVPEVHPEHEEDDQDAQEGGYPGRPSNTFILIYYHDHAARHIWDGIDAHKMNYDIPNMSPLATACRGYFPKGGTRRRRLSTFLLERMPIKSVNHLRKIFDLFKPQAQWFNVVGESGLDRLCCTGYVTIIHCMQRAFAERWHKETLSFHFRVGGLTITLHDVACLLNLPIRGRLLDHSLIQRVDAIEWMVDYMGMDSYMADVECRKNNGAHIRFSSLKELYENHLVAATEFEEKGDGFLLSTTELASCGVG